jgi:glycosyltransferase involved in cell wall biosynthesis
MKKNVLIDNRWAGDTGIGRLYKEVMMRKPVEVNTSFVKSQLSLGSIYTPIMLARAIKASSADIFYSPSFMPPLYSNIPFVFTVHDLMHLFYYSGFHKIYYKQVIGRLAKRAKKIITVSHFSKHQLVDLLGINEDIITVIYNGVDDNFLLNNEKYEMENPYLLYVGNRRKNKNIPAMLEAFAKANIPNEIVLALTGKEDKVLADEINKLGLKQRVKFLGFVTDEELPKLYKGALATLYVSLMEGFGLPIIESMASGTPVLTSTASSLPEIAGDAALCVDPLDTTAITDGIERLVNDSSLYQHYVVEGKKRALDFKWQDTAFHTWETILH